MKFYNLKKHTKTRKALRNNMPSAEVILWTHLKRKRFQGLKFRRQYGIDRYVVDFYCPKLRLAIELDGINHLEKKQKLKDQKRQAEIESFGIKVLRYMNTDIYDNIDGVVENLNCKINEMNFPD
tara:strand:- start:9311 stop:9682 length:372 start_codon:yes stop_codon:yes gene_type:complete